MRGTYRLGALLLAVALAGCGVSREQFDAALAERDALSAKVKKLEDELDAQKAKAVELQRKLDDSAVSAKPTRPPEQQVAAARAELKLEPGQKLYASLKTTEGDIECELFPELAPTTVLNFVGLAEGTKSWTDPATNGSVDRPLYKGTLFHRVIKGFMIQGGDPLGNGRGGPGYKFGDEVWPDVRFDKPGQLAMANAGPNTNGSQFFVTVGTPQHLNMRHTIFGQCEPGVAIKISEVATGPGDRPLKDVVLKDVVITRK